MDLLVRNGRIIDPLNGIDHFGDVFVVDGIIRNVRQSLSKSSATCSIFDATDLIVCPGFIDLHCHLRQPGYEEKETIATGTAAAAAGGFTTVCCMPNTNPAIATKSIIEQILSFAADEGKVRVLPIGCVTENREGSKMADLATLHKAGVVAFSDDGSPVYDAEIMRQALKQSKALNLPIIDHCEDMGLSHKGSMNEGTVAKRLGLKGIPSAAEERIVERDIGLAEKTGGWIHIAHVSTVGSIEMIRQAKLSGVRITAEVTPHHLTLTEDTVITCGTAAKVNPPLRTEQDRRSLVQGLLDGTIDVIATDHAPHTSADKNCDFEQAAFGISGLETALGSLLRLVQYGEIDLITIISKLTCEPARILNNPMIGNLNPGSTADITIFNPHTEWVVDPKQFLSKGKNTPLTGITLKGRVAAMFIAGEPVFPIVI